MSTVFADPAMSAGLSIIVKASIVLTVAAGVQGLLRRRTSAATRHLVWTLAIAGVLALPLLSLTVPEWAVVVRAGARQTLDQPRIVADAAADIATPEITPAPVAASPEPPRIAAPAFEMTWTAAMASVYAAGVFVLLIHFLGSSGT